MRSRNRAALVVIIDNINSNTNVKFIATRSSTGVFFNFDWEATDDFEYSVKNILNEYVIE